MSHAYYVDKNGKVTKGSKKKKKQTEFLYTVDAKGKVTKNNNTEDIAPVKSKKKDKKDTWFKAGGFSDGVDSVGDFFGDLGETVVGTVGDVGVGLGKGLTRMGEGIGDALRYGVAGVADLTGNDNYAERLRKSAKENDTDDIWKKAEKKVDKNSVLGNKSDKVTEGLGQVAGIILTGGVAGGLGASAGVASAITTGTVGISGIGSGISEAYQSGATDKEAYTYGTIAGTGEALTELLFGGLGKTVKATGLSKGLSSADDMLAKKISGMFNNQIAKNFAEFGIKSGAEGTEEVLSGIISAVGKKVTYMEEEELSKILEDEDLLEQFVVGSITSGIAQSGVVPGMKQGSLIEANKQGKDFITGLTTNEQKVVDKEFENRISEAEKDGKKLSEKDKTKIYDEVLNDLDKGYISTDTIESAIGDKTYETYKTMEEQENSIREEIESLENTPDNQFTVKQRERLTELREELTKIDKTQVKNQLSSEVSELAKVDRLSESYNEKARRSETFKADLSKYDTKQQEVIKRATESGILNNTNRTHEFVDMVAKISADKGVLFDFTNNQKLKDSGFAVEGKTVNGYKTKDGNIGINIDSHKSLNSVVGHEITHVLEGTELYTELQEAVTNYAKTKGDYDTRYNELAELYKDIEDDIEGEVTADLVGDYLFTDKDFVNNLSVEKPNIFKKIFNEIKYLYKMATAGSKEARQLEKVKRTFENAYKENISKNSDTKHSFSGTRAKTANKSLLHEAEHMLDTGVDSETVRQETGWFKSYDGKMRFEIDDSQMKVYQNGDAVFSKSHPEYAELQELKKKKENSGITAEELSRLEELDKTWGNENERLNDLLRSGNLKLKHILEHDKLYENYPELKDMDIKIARSEEIGNGVRGSYNPSKKSITINEKLLGGDTSEVKKTLIHEIQHAIQDIEGFTSGSSEEYWQDRLDSGESIKTSEQKAKLQKLKKEYEDISKNEPEFFKEMNELEEMTPTVSRGAIDWDTLEKIEEDPIEWQNFDKKRDSLSEKYGEIKVYDFMDLQYEIKELERKSITASDAYYKTAGEIEARDTANRLSLNEEQRKATRPDIDKEDVVYSDNAKYSLSDSTGKELTKEQQDYFKDSKVRDDNGNLLVMYHGTSNGGHTVFDTYGSNFGLFGQGSYFTDNKSVAESYTNKGRGNNKQVYEVYLNITNPMDMDAQANIEEWQNAFPDADFSTSITNEDCFRAMEEYFYDYEYTKYDAYEEAWDAITNMGYDGLTHIGGGRFNKADDTRHRVYIAYEPEQVKNIDNTKPTSDPDIRFSLSKPVEKTKDLVAVHNLTSNELAKSLELGGLPMPSVAIIKAKQNFDKYGDVSLILNKDAIDPKTSKDNKVYGGDAWTPVYPKIEYKSNEKVAKQIRDKYYELSKKIGHDNIRPMYRYVSDLEDSLNRDGGEVEMLQKLYDNTEMMQVYLEDTGKGKVDKIIKEVRTEATETEKEMSQWFVDKLGKDVIREVKTPEGETIMSHRRKYFAEYGEQIKTVYGEYLEEKLNFTDEQIKNAIDKLNRLDLLHFIRNTENYLDNGGVTVREETDLKATEEAIREKATDGYKEWIDSIFKGVEEKSGIRNDVEPFTNSGNRRKWDALHWENTLENVIKVMKSQDQTGADAMSPSSAIFAVSQKKYGSIDDIKADSNRLGEVSEEEYKALEESYANRFSQIANSIKNNNASNPFIAMDESANLIIDAIRTKKTKASMLSYMQKWNKRVTAKTVDDIVSLVSDIANMPTGYFEAKPQRAVGLDEVGVFVIPYNADAKLKQELLNKGYSIAEYNPDVEGDRQRVVNQFEDYKFSLANRGNSIAPYGNYNVYGKDIALEQNIAPEQNFAPAQETIPVQETTLENETVVDDVAPLMETNDTQQSQEDIVPIQQAEEMQMPTMTRPSEPNIINVPSAPSPNGKQRKWVETSTESEAVGRKILPKDLDQNKITYQPISNKKTLNNANAMLDRDGYDDSVAYFNSQFKNKRISLDDIALGERLIQEAVKKGDMATAGELIQNVSILGTELGQKVQALSIIQRLTPEGQLKTLTKMVERGKAKGDKAFEGVEITQDMIDHILKTYGKDGTYNQEELDKAVEEVKQKIAKQMKVTKMDKVNAWRYLSMLGNPKTHVRNIVSNVGMKGTMAVKDAIARTIETVAPVKNRTKTWQSASEEVKEFANQTTKEMKSILEDGGKYSDTNDIKSKRQMFENKVLNAVYEFNSDMLSKEDWWFQSSAFNKAFSEYLTANGISTKEDIENNAELIEKAKTYATEQSEIATFKQYSFIAHKLNEIESKNTATQIATGAIVPFKKTPVNIAKTGLNYSPLGFMKTLTYDASQVKKGNMEASEMIDHLSQNITGTGLALAGYMLAMSGFLNGAGKEDKEGKYDYQLGKQAYSVNIGGNTYSLSWLTPVAMPLFVGANAFETLTEGKEWDGNVVIEALTQTLDPMSEMSVLSGLTNVLSSYEKGSGIWADIAQTTGQNYVTQFVPTLSGQIATAMDDKQRSTKVAGNSGFKFLEETVNKLKLKIPILRETLEPSTDVWGKEVKLNENKMQKAFDTFIAPYSRKESASTQIDEELKDLYADTGDGGLFPQVPKNSVNYKGEKYNMSAKEYTSFKKTYGQNALDLMEELFQTTTYQNASSSDKADMVDKVYDYASDEAKREYLAKKDVEYTNATKDGEAYYKENTIKGAIENDMPLEEFDFYNKYPKKYKFLQQNNVSYEDYSSDKETKEAYNWAYSNPEKYTLSKAVSSDVKTYRAYTKDLYEIKSDKDKYGKSISGSRKEKVSNYINSLDADYGEKLILFKSEYNADDRYNREIINYLNNRDDITFDEMNTILKELGFTVTADGTIYWN